MMMMNKAVGGGLSLGPHAPAAVCIVSHSCQAFLAVQTDVTFTERISHSADYVLGSVELPRIPVKTSRLQLCETAEPNRVSFHPGDWTWTLDRNKSEAFSWAYSHRGFTANARRVFQRGLETDPVQLVFGVGIASVQKVGALASVVRGENACWSTQQALA